MDELLKKTREYNVLFVDDEEDIRKVMSMLLKKFFKSIDISENGEDALKKYLQKEYDIIITDFTMPKMNGVELIEKVKAINPNQKIIILSAHQDKEDFYKALLAQADGYLIKPFDVEVFKKIIRKISHQIELEKINYQYQNSLEKLLEKKAKKLQEKFFYDELTSLPNTNKLKEDLKNIKEDNYFIGIDISNFRKINSIFGIENGNLILQKIAYFLKSIYKDISLYRLQDSSFAYVCKEESIDIYKVLNKLQKDLSQFKVQINSIDISFTFKVIAVSGKEDILDKYILVSSYLKDRGIKQIYQYFDDKVDEIKKQQENMLFWVNRSLEAVNYSNIEPFFQAIVDNKTQKTIKYEVLARLKDGEKYVSPFFFIEPAKEAGILSLITRMIIKKAFKKIANSNISLSINITSNDLEENYLEEFLLDEVSKNNLNPSQITLEILEGIESKNNERHLSQLLSLKEKGFSIAIDDFGTGYSNFERVYQIKPDFIKIDGIYIKDITKNTNSLKITNAIINFAKSIDAKIVAEFVSSEEIYKKVKELGIEYSQGYYFSEPKLNIEV